MSGYLYLWDNRFSQWAILSLDVTQPTRLYLNVHSYETLKSHTVMVLSRVSLHKVYASECLQFKTTKLLHFVFPIKVHRRHPTIKLRDITFHKNNFNSHVWHFINLSVLELNAWSPAGYRSGPELKGDYNPLLAEVDIWCFEHHTAHYESVNVCHQKINVIPGKCSWDSDCDLGKEL